MDVINVVIFVAFSKGRFPYDYERCDSGGGGGGVGGCDVTEKRAKSSIMVF